MMRSELTPSAGGEMTALMRAAAPTRGPKSLRIALVQGSKVLEERVIARQGEVTVGTSATNVFVIAGEGAPTHFKLFERIRGVYYLNAHAGMTGRVALDGGAADLSSILDPLVQADPGAGRAHRIRLGEGARGRVTVGDVAFLFELCSPPLVHPRPQLPTSVRSALDVDWTTTFIAALSFLFHFGVVGSIYSDWMDPIVDDRIDVAQLIDSVKALPDPPAVEVPKEHVDAGAVRATPRGPAEPAHGPSARPAGQARNGASVADRKATQIAEDLRSLDVAMQTVLNGRGASTDKVLDGSDLPVSILDEIATTHSTTTNDRSAGLRLGGASGRVARPGEGADRWQGLSNTGSGERAASGGQAQRPTGPSGSVSVAGGQPRVGRVPGAEAVVAGMAPGFRRCYNKGLLDDATMRGSIRILAKIGPNGDVLSATPSSASGTLSGAVIGCVVARVGSAHFAAPDDGGATLEIPASFQPQ